MCYTSRHTKRFPVAVASLASIARPLESAQGHAVDIKVLFSRHCFSGKKASTMYDSAFTGLFHPMNTTDFELHICGRNNPCARKRSLSRHLNKSYPVTPGLTAQPPVWLAYLENRMLPAWDSKTCSDGGLWSWTGYPSEICITAAACLLIKGRALSACRVPSFHVDRISTQ